MKIKTVTLLSACVACLEWTRLAGTVKSVNLKDSTVTIENRDGDLLTIPVDYQISMVEKHGELRGIKTLKLDEKITLTRIQSEKPIDDSEGLVPPDSSAHGK